MNETPAIEANLKGLDQLIKMLKKPAVARVGILGGSDSRKGKGSNAEVGMKHEYGKDGMPVRSFLRMPLIDQLEKAMKQSSAFKASVLSDSIKKGSMVPYMKVLAVIAEGVIAEAFATGGFGKWQPSNMANKKNHQTLVETQQLRNSITSEVKE